MYLESFIQMLQDSGADKHYRVHLEVNRDFSGKPSYDVEVDHNMHQLIVTESY